MSSPPENPSSSESVDDTAPPPGPGPGPRAFAQGTGLVLQTVGMILFLSSCCICSMFSGLWDPHEFSIDESTRLVESGATLASSFELLSENPARAGTALMVFFSTVGGLALAGFGLGLQGENMKAAYGAVISLAIMIVLLGIAGFALWLGDGSIASRIINAGLILLMLVLTGFALAALREMRRHPPPPDLHVLPADYPLPIDPFLKKRSH